MEGMHYADRSDPGGASGPPAAFFQLARSAGEALAVYVPDDGRSFSHRSLVELFRDRPEIWKHRSPDAIPWPEAPDAPPEDLAAEEVGEPEALALGPATLRRVVPVNQIQSIDGLTIALISLEQHLDGARLRYMAHASDARTRRQMRLLDVAAVDDRGRRYRVASTDARAEGNRLEGCLVLAPALSHERARLTVTVGTVGAEVADDEERSIRLSPVSGPWVFPIPLTPAGPA